MSVRSVMMAAGGSKAGDLSAVSGLLTSTATVISGGWGIVSGVVWTGQRFLRLGDSISDFQYSPDAITWYPLSSAGNGGEIVSDGAGNVLSLLSNTQFKASTDHGSTFTLKFTAPNTFTGMKAFYASGRWFIMGTGNNNNAWAPGFYHSANLTNWTRVQFASGSFNSSNYLRSHSAAKDPVSGRWVLIAWHAGQAVFKAYYSSDLVTWTEATSFASTVVAGANWLFGDIYYWNGKFRAYGWKGAGGVCEMSSADGITWSMSTAAATASGINGNMCTFVCTKTDAAVVIAREDTSLKTTTYKYLSTTDGQTYTLNFSHTYSWPTVSGSQLSRNFISNYSGGTNIAWSPTLRRLALATLGVNSAFTASECRTFIYS